MLSFADLQRKGGVLEHRHVRPDRVGLEHHAEAAPVGRHEDAFERDEKTTRAVDRDLAGARPLEARDRAQRRGLAAAARAEQREELPLGHRRSSTSWAAVTISPRSFGVLACNRPLDVQHVRLPLIP